MKMKLIAGKGVIIKTVAILLILSVGFMSPLNPTSPGIVHASGFILVALRYAPTSIVINDTATFDGNWTGGQSAWTYSLSFGDGTPNATGTVTGLSNTGSITPVTHKYATAGSFTSGLSVKDATGGAGKTSITVSVRGSLVTDFSFVPSSASFGDRVQFTGSVRNGTRTPAGTYNFTYNWNYGDGVNNVTKLSTATNPSVTPATSSSTHVMSGSGTLTVTLKVVDPYGQSGTATHQIQIKGLLGIDCGYGSNEAVNNVTGYPNPDGALNTGSAGKATIDSSCSWAGGPDLSGGGTYLTPLVSDSPTSIGLSCCATQGGGFTADIVYIQRGTSTAVTGFDVTVSWKPQVLYAVEFDQSGLTFNGGSTFTALSSIDNIAGTAELSQVLTGAAASDNVTLFRIRFDVVGVGTTGLTISNDLIIDSNLVPNSLPHTTIQGSFTSANIPDFLATATLGYMVNWTYAPNPEITGAPLTLTAKASCSGCTGTLTYKWDTDSVQGYPDSSKPPATIEASGSSATITAPTATLMAHRITLIVNDTAGHVAEATRRLPLSLPVVSAMGAFTVGSPQQLQAKWLGGVPPYSGGPSGQVGVKWTLCNPTSPANVICSNAIPSTTTTSSQNNNVTITYHFAGVYTGSVIVTDTGLLWIPSSPASTPKVNFQVNVTGTPQAFSLVVTTDASTGASVGQTVTINATSIYNSAYPASARSSKFNYTINFGDGSSQQILPQNSPLLVTHTYSSLGTFAITVWAQENSANALAKIMEVGFATQPVVTALTGSFNFSPSSPTQAEPVSFTGTASGGQGPYTYSWDFGDGSSGSGAAASHSYSSSGSFTVKLTITDSLGRTTSLTQTVTIPGTPGGSNSSTLYLEIGGIVAAIVAGLAGLLFLRKRRTRNPSNR